MTYCCNNIQRAKDLIVKAGGILNWSEDFGAGDAFLAGFTLGISSNIKQAGDLKEAQRRINNAYSTLVDAEKAINACSCVSMDEYNRLVREFNDLNKGSVNKDGYNKLWSEYSKNIDDYNKLNRNSVSKGTYERLENEYKQNIKDYNELVGEHKTLAERARNLQEKYNKLVDEYNDKNTDYHDMKEKYEDTNEKLHGEKLKHANEMGNEKLKHKDKSSLLDIKIARLEEKLETANSDRIDLRKRLTDKENENNRLLIKLDDKNSQLTVLRIESGEKESRLREKETELSRKNEEIERLKRKGGLSQEELLTEKLRSEKGNLELLANELKIGSEKIHSLTKYHERLFVAQKNHNQANIDIHEGNISRVKQELTDQEISVVHIQEICRKCEVISKLRWELEQNQQQFEARQEVPTN